MHFHISMYDENERNLFMKINDNYQNNLYHAVGGLLQQMPISMPIFAPTPNCYERYKLDNTKHIQYPTNYSWGINNRTCAIRIPQSTTEDPQDTRIEHRVCSGIADPYQSLSVIIEAIENGIVNKIKPPEPIFGNSFDSQYNCIKIIS
jgi:glutamine synthetase